MLEIAGCAVIFLAYDRVRDHLAGPAGIAFRNAKDIIRAEQWLGLYQERAIQQAFLSADWFMAFWNIYYGTIHFVVPVVALVLLYRKMPAFFSTDEYGVPDVVQRLHWDHNRAVELGLPAPYDYGTMRTNWLGHLITNWMGDDAWLWRLKTQARAFNFMGDFTTCAGEVVDKRVDNGRYVVDLKVAATNQRGQVSSPGSATVVLPSRASGAILLPTPAQALSERGGNMMAEAAQRLRKAG